MNERESKAYAREQATVDELRLKLLFWRAVGFIMIVARIMEALDK